jgi:hypothetical protein
MTGNVESAAFILGIFMLMANTCSKDFSVNHRISVAENSRQIETSWGDIKGKPVSQLLGLKEVKEPTK